MYWIKALISKRLHNKARVLHPDSQTIGSCEVLLLDMLMSLWCIIPIDEIREELFVPGLG